MTHAVRDAAYNNSAAVSDSSQIIDRWVAASAAVRSQRPKHLDLACGPGERNNRQASRPIGRCLLREALTARNQLTRPLECDGHHQHKAGKLE
jgi:hypothetical protein